MTHAIPGRRTVAEALRAGRVLVEVVFDDRGGPHLRELRAQAEAAGVPVRTARRSEVDLLAHGVVHQGVVAVQREFPYVSLDTLASSGLVVVLDGLTDPQNLGGIARSSEAAGAGGLVLPRRRSAAVGPAAEKAAAGAFAWLRVALAPNVSRALADLAGHGFWSVGLTGDAGEKAEPLWSSRLMEGKVALVVGAEGAGLSRLAGERVDGLVTIPMVGRLESLNASAATAIALFEVVRRHSTD
ncbi:MAG: 23S rRNA (guanosine(2251)-2'-O)-methyltransferase RlmB [Nitriliruptorales bacterium]|nr:23S rRNA (guanosine(2251)-2'-O)-methyltransferase RlmB [Nitriliruptorales bacterium]